MDSLKWEAVRDGVVADIRSGAYPVGSTIPSPPDLIRRFDCDRNTIRKALTYLRDIGVLETKVGSGTRVAALPPDALPGRPRPASLADRVAALEARVEQLERQQPPTSR